MAPRQQLHNLLKQITENVYFQPPNNAQIKYPCITYSRDGDNTEFADNQPYTQAKRYQVTVIDRNPDSAIPDAVEELRFCSFSRFFASDNLNHHVFNLFF